MASPRGWGSVVEEGSDVLDKDAELSFLSFLSRRNNDPEAIAVDTIAADVQASPVNLPRRDELDLLAFPQTSVGDLTVLLNVILDHVIEYLEIEVAVGSTVTLVTVLLDTFGQLFHPDHPLSRGRSDGAG